MKDCSTSKLIQFITLVFASSDSYTDCCCSLCNNFKSLVAAACFRLFHTLLMMYTIMNTVNVIAIVQKTIKL